MSPALSVVTGVVLGAANAYVLFRLGWKPAAIMVLAFCVGVFVVASRTGVGHHEEGGLLVSFAVARLSVEPWLRRRLSSREA